MSQIFSVSLYFRLLNGMLLYLDNQWSQMFARNINIIGMIENNEIFIIFHQL
jgi:hypothetical protein